MPTTRTRAPRPRRTGFGDVTLRSTERLRDAIEESGQPLRRIAATTRALAEWKPAMYAELSYQTISNLLSGRQSTLAVLRAQALEEALTLEAGALFALELVNERSSSVHGPYDTADGSAVGAEATAVDVESADVPVERSA